MIVELLYSTSFLRVVASKLSESSSSKDRSGGVVMMVRKEDAQNTASSLGPPSNLGKGELKQESRCQRSFKGTTMKGADHVRMLGVLSM